MDPVTNFAKVEVTQGYNAAATSIVIATGGAAKLPDPAVDGAFNLVWYNATDYASPGDDPNVEIVRCTAIATETLTITRAQESTGATVKNIGAKTYRMLLTPTKKTMDDLATVAGLTWSEVTGTSQAGAVRTAYIANNAGLVTVTLPSTAPVGSEIKVIGHGAGGWKLAQNASEIIYFGTSTTTTGVGGSLASTAAKDTVELVCTVADTEWVVYGAVGTLTVT